MVTAFTLLFSNGGVFHLTFANTVEIPRASSFYFSTDFKLPPALGTVAEIQYRPQKPFVILLQDAHSVPDAQKSMEKIVEYFQKKYGVSLIGLEGASGKLDPTLLRAFPDPERLKKVFGDYLSRGELSGAAAASVLSPRPADFYGLEDQKLYEEGVTAFLEALHAQAPILAKLQKLRARLEKKKEKIYSKKLLEVDQAIKAFNEDHSDLMKVLRVLKEIGDRHKQNMRACPLFLKSLLEESDSPEIEREIKKIAEQIKNPSDAIFNQKYQAFQTSQISAVEFAVYLKENYAVVFSPRLSCLIVNYKHLRDIQSAKFFKAFEAYAQAVKKSLFRNEEEKKLDQKSRQLHLLEKLVKLELSRAEWEQVKRTNVGAPLVGALDERAGTRPAPTRMLEAHFAFYQNAEKRDEVLFKNLMKLMRLSTHNPVPSTCLFVAGGFHTEGLREVFSKQGIGFAVLTPAIQEIPKDTHYLDYMQGQVSWKNYFEVRNGRIDLFKAFSKATVDRLLTENATVLKPWRDSVIRNLAKQNKLSVSRRYTKFLDQAAVRRMNPERYEQLKKEWHTKVGHFLAGLHLLKNQNRFTPENILQLANVSKNIFPAAVGSLQPRSTALALWSEPKLLNSAVSAVRSKLREKGRRDRIAIRGLSFSNFSADWLAEEIKKAINDPNNWPDYSLKTQFLDEEELHFPIERAARVLLNNVRNGDDSPKAIEDFLNLFFWQENGDSLSEGGILYGFIINPLAGIIHSLIPEIRKKLKEQAAIRRERRRILESIGEQMSVPFPGKSIPRPLVYRMPNPRRSELRSVLSAENFTGQESPAAKIEMMGTEQISWARKIGRRLQVLSLKAERFGGILLAVFSVPFTLGIFYAFLSKYLVVQNFESHPKGKRSFIVVGNHVSYLDGFILACLFLKFLGRLPRVIARPTDLGRYMRSLVDAGFALAIDRGRTSEKMKDYLKRGLIIVVFPKDKLEKRAQLNKWHDSFIYAAMGTGVDIWVFAASGVVQRFVKWRDLKKLLWFSLSSQQDQGKEFFHRFFDFGAVISTAGKTFEQIKAEVQKAQGEIQHGKKVVSVNSQDSNIYRYELNNGKLVTSREIFLNGAARRSRRSEVRNDDAGRNGEAERPKKSSGESRNGSAIPWRESFTGFPKEEKGLKVKLRQALQGHLGIFFLNLSEENERRLIKELIPKLEQALAAVFQDEYLISHGRIRNSVITSYESSELEAEGYVFKFSILKSKNEYQIFLSNFLNAKKEERYIHEWSLPEKLVMSSLLSIPIEDKNPVEFAASPSWSEDHQAVKIAVSFRPGAKDVHKIFAWVFKRKDGLNEIWELEEASLHEEEGITYAVWKPQDFDQESLKFSFVALTGVETKKQKSEITYLLRLLGENQFRDVRYHPRWATDWGEFWILTKTPEGAVEIIFNQPPFLKPAVASGSEEIDFSKNGSALALQNSVSRSELRMEDGPDPRENQIEDAEFRRLVENAQDELTELESSVQQWRAHLIGFDVQKFTKELTAAIGTIRFLMIYDFENPLRQGQTNLLLAKLGKLQRTFTNEILPASKVPANQVLVASGRSELRLAATRVLNELAQGNLSIPTLRGIPSDAARLTAFENEVKRSEVRFAAAYAAAQDYDRPSLSQKAIDYADQLVLSSHRPRILRTDLEKSDITQEFLETLATIGSLGHRLILSVSDKPFERRLNREIDHFFATHNASSYRKNIRIEYISKRDEEIAEIQNSAESGQVDLITDYDWAVKMAAISGISKAVQRIVVADKMIHQLANAPIKATPLLKLGAVVASLLDKVSPNLSIGSNQLFFPDEDMVSILSELNLATRQASLRSA